MSPPMAVSARVWPGAVALAALAATAALAVFCFVKVVGLVLLGAPRREAVAAAVESPWSMRAAVGVLAVGCVVLGLVPGFLFASLVGLAPWPASAPSTAGLRLPGTGSLPTPGIAVVLVGLTAGLVLLRGRRSAAPAPSWACGQLVEPPLRLDECGVHEAAPARARGACCDREREIAVRSGGGVRAGGLLPGPCSAPDRGAALPAGRAACRSARRYMRGGCRAAGSAPTSPT